MYNPFTFWEAKWTLERQTAYFGVFILVLIVAYIFQEKIANQELIINYICIEYIFLFMETFF